MSMSHVSGTIVPADSDDDDFEQLFPPRFVPLPPLDDTLSSHTVSKSNELPPMSDTAKALLGRRDPVNTTRNNQVGMRSLAKFLCRFEGIVVNSSDDGALLQQAKKILFPGRKDDDQNDWTDDELKRVRHYLIEFVSDMCKENGKLLKPTTIKNYILSVHKGFACMWDINLKLLTGPVFVCKKEGLIPVLNNKIRELQAKGLHTSSHIVLSTSDLEKLFASLSLSKQTPRGFQTKLVFSIGLLTIMRPTALWNLSINQFQKTKIRDQVVWKITHAVGSLIGSLKTKSGGWRSVGQKSPEVCIWNEDYYQEKLNFYKDIDEYMDIRAETPTDADRFFLGINVGASDPRHFFKGQPMGRNTFMRLVKNACVAENVEGEGLKNWSTTHGLRGTLATILFEHGHSDSSVALRTGHRDINSLKSYQHLRGETSLAQQRHLASSGTQQDGSSIGCSVTKESDKRMKRDSNVFDQGQLSERNHVLADTAHGTGYYGIVPGTLFSHVGSVTGNNISVTINHYRDRPRHGDESE